MKDEATQQFGALMRARRTAQGISQEALAAAAFANADRKSYVSALENGRLKRITPATATRLAGVLDMPREDIPPALRLPDPQISSPVEERLDALEARRMEAHDLSALVNAQLAGRLRVGMSELYFERLDQGLTLLAHWVGGPFSARSLAVSFALAFVYVVLAGLASLAGGVQQVGGSTPFAAAWLVPPAFDGAVALGLVGAVLASGALCARLLRVSGQAGVPAGRQSLRIGLAALVAGLATTLVALLTGEPIAVALFFAVLCLGALAQLPPRAAALAGLGGGLLAGPVPGLTAPGTLPAPWLEGMVIGATIGAVAGLAASLTARCAPSAAAGRVAGGGAGVAVGVLLLSLGLLTAQALADIRSSTTAMVVLMWLALPFANAATDYLSLGVSHWLGRQARRTPNLRKALALALLDLALAAVLMLATVKGIAVALAAADAVFGTGFDGPAFVAGSLADLWGRGLWLAMMVLSTVAWTYGHFALVVVPLLAGRLVHHLLERPVRTRLARADHGGGIDFEAALAIPARPLVFGALCLVLAALPPAILVAGAGGLESFLRLAL